MFLYLNINFKQHFRALRRAVSFNNKHKQLKIRSIFVISHLNEHIHTHTHTQIQK